MKERREENYIHVAYITYTCVFREREAHGALLAQGELGAKMTSQMD
jgi:hypothetical protein